eukprot:scaffold9572_cov66-Skeletonema_dohrnii-CCMP3373.AAC.2
MEVYHVEEAAIAGHPGARRYNLGYNEWENERFLRAAKHLITAAILGHDDSLQALKEYYKDGLVRKGKDDFAAAFHAHQAAVMLQRFHRGRRPRKSMQQIVHRRTQSRIMHDMTGVGNLLATIRYPRQGIEELDLKSNLVLPWKHGRKSLGGERRIWKQVVVPMPPPSTSVNSLCLLEVESERRATTSVAYSLILILDRCYVNY